MRIGIDCRILCRPKSGIYIYLMGLLKQIPQVDKTNEYYLFFDNPEIPQELNNYAKFRPVVIPCPFVSVAKGHNYVAPIWLNFLLPRAIEKLGIEVMFYPNSLAPFRSKSKSVITIHDMSPFVIPEMVQPLWGAYIRPNILFSLQVAQHVFVDSAFTRNALLKHSSVNPSKVKLIYPGIDACDSFCAINDQSIFSDLKQKLKLPDRFILFVGTFEQRKNVVTLLDAYHKLIQRKEIRHDLVLRSSGGYGTRDVQRAFKRLELGDRVHIVEQLTQKDLIALYNLADVFAFPSVYEGFGLPVLEAMACGTPVVSSNASALPEIVGDAGLLVDPHDTDGWTKALRIAIDDEDLRRNLREKGRERVKCFSWESTARKVVNILTGGVDVIDKTWSPAKDKPNKVGIIKTDSACYPKSPPFSPSEKYPEYPLSSSDHTPNNTIYAAFRQNLALLGLDAVNYGKPIWNPLGQIIRPGDKVVLKPNFIMHRHWGKGDIESVITHGSILRAVIDYVVIALKGKGRIIVADAPMGSADFRQIMQASGMEIIQNFYQEHGITIEVLDLRTRSYVQKDHLTVGQKSLAGDPAGYVSVDLKKHSSFMGLANAERIRGSDYESEETIAHHSDGHHAYFIARTILDSDVVINLPKLKTHTKAGVTLNLKNLVGINGDKNCIPHFRVGGQDQGGDEFPDVNIIRKCMSWMEDCIKRRIPSMGRMELFITGKARRIHKAWSNLSGWMPYRNGGWYGNDTLWRSILDLNRILLYADSEGFIQTTKQRRLFSVMDGIIGGEHNGPLYPQTKPCGVLLVGENLLALDLCAARLMGFDYKKIPHLYHALDKHAYPLGGFLPEDIDVRTNEPKWVNMCTDPATPFLNFVPADGWRGYIEI